jgi:hypothetical protein
MASMLTEAAVAGAMILQCRASGYLCSKRAPENRFFATASSYDTEAAPGMSDREALVPPPGIWLDSSSLGGLVFFLFSLLGRDGLLCGEARRLCDNTRPSDQNETAEMDASSGWWASGVG